MKTVNTVTGPVSTDNLGKTLMHEHLFTMCPEYRCEYPMDEEAQVASAVRQMKELVSLGVKTLVDMTVFGLGRCAPRARRIANESGMQIIAAAGIYTFSDMPMFFKRGIEYDGPNYVQEFLIREIEEGIGDTGIKPAVLKCASEGDITKDVEQVLRIIAQVHRKTGVLIATHSKPSTKDGLEQQRIFEEEGVDLSRVMIGHIGDSTDLEYIEKLLSKGSIIGMDRFGAERLCPNKVRVATVAELVKRGYAKQMILSHDLTCESDFFSRERALRRPGYAEYRRYTYISDVILPQLLEAGVSQDDIDQMMICNPKRIFEQSGRY